MLFKDQKFWVVGASEGIGFTLTQRLLAEGAQVVASSRSATSHRALKSLAVDYIDTLHLLDIDVTSDESVKNATQLAWTVFDGLDVWFYNVGDYQSMQSQDWESNVFEQLSNVNYLGCTRLMCELMPKFSVQGHGRWVWNLSLASLMGLPYGGAYSAPKAALLNLAESIQPELNTQGINLHVINHGFVKTRLTDRNDFQMPDLLTAEQAADHIMRHLTSKQGFQWVFPKRLGSVLRLLRLLPYSWSLGLTKRLLK